MKIKYYRVKWAHGDNSIMKLVNNHWYEWDLDNKIWWHSDSPKKTGWESIELSDEQAFMELL